MAWSASKIFVTYIEDALENVAAYDIGATPDVIKAALFDNVTAPDNTASTANRTMGAGVWTDANEVYDGAEWTALGTVIANTTFAPTAAVLKFDGDNTVSAGTSATLADVYGCMVHDSTLSNLGMCYNYFGGVNSVGGRV